MNKEIDCNIIDDLLPSYLSNITSFNTNKSIEEHINRCSKCEKKLAYMKMDISLNNIKEPIDDIKINYFKKIHKKFFYILLISILIMIISFIASVFLSEKNIDEAIFTIALYIFIIVGIFISYNKFKLYKQEKYSSQILNNYNMKKRGDRKNRSPP